MREEEANWFARWEDELPSPDELMPLSQTLITPDLALAFDIPTSSPSAHPPPPPPDFDAAAADDAARTLKRPRLVWTPQLHKRFVDAVAQLGIKTAVPKTIMQLMSVDGLTRENVASHLQKYRLYLKRMKGAAGGSAAGGGISAADHQLFATAAAPVPHHFLNRGAAPAFSPYASALQQQHHQLAAQQYYQQRQAGQFGMPMGGAGFEHAFLARPQLGVHRMLGAAALGMVQTSARPEEQDLMSGGGGRRELTLFPTADV